MTKTSRFVTFSCMRPSTLDETDLAAWRAALDATPSGSPFLSAGYALACEAAGFDTRVVVAGARNGEASGFMAFQLADGPAGHLGLGVRAGGGMTDYFVPVATGPDLEPCDILAFYRASGCRLLDLSHAPVHAPLSGEDVAPADGSPATVMPNGFAKWWETQEQENKSRTRDLARRQRKLEREAGEISLILDTPYTPDLLDEIVAMKRTQYVDRETKDVFVDSRNLRLLHTLATQNDEQSRLILTTLDAGDKRAAAHIGLANGPVLHYWFPVYEETLKRTSPGRILILEMLRAMDDAGFQELDYGAGESRTKLEFANEIRPLLKGTWRRPGPMGLLARVGQSLLWRLA